MLDVLTFREIKTIRCFSESGKTSLIVSLRQMKAKRWQEKKKPAGKPGK